jgi:RHS repeat-associated protein
MRSVPTMTPKLIVLTFVMLLILMMCSGTNAQPLSARPEHGSGSKGSDQTTDVDSISLQDGAVNLQIPLASLPAVAGGKLSYTLTASYSSKLWEVLRKEMIGQTNSGCQPRYTTEEVGYSIGGGWRVGGKYQVYFRDAKEDYEYLEPDDYNCYGSDYNDMTGRYFKPMLRMPDGSEKELRLSPTSSLGTNFSYYPGSTRDHLQGYIRYTGSFGVVTLNGPVTFYTTDGSYISVVVDAFTPGTSAPWNYPPTWKLYFKDGTRVEQSSAGQRIKDNNGNSILITNDSATDEHTGRQIKWSNTTYNNQSATKVEYQSTGGSWQNVWVVWGETTVTGKVYFKTDWEDHSSLSPISDTCFSHTIIPSTPFSVIRQIIYPSTETNVAGQTYSFEYNSDDTEQTSTTGFHSTCDLNQSSTYSRTASIGLGELSQVTTPTGAVINYDYAWDGKHDFTDSYSSEVGNEDANEIVRNVVESKSVDHDNTTDVWTYNISRVTNSRRIEGASITNPDGSTYDESYYPTDIAFQANSSTDGKGGLAFESSQSNGVVVKRKWALLGGPIIATGSNNSYVGWNPVVDTEFTTYPGVNGSPAKMKATKFSYDFNGDLTQTIEYDWINLANVTYGADSVPTGVPTGTQVLRVVDNSYYNTASSSTSSTAYHRRTLGTSPVILGKPSQTTVGNGTTTKRDTKFSYDGNSWGTAPSLGNLTKVSAYNDTTSSWIDSTSAYDSKGNVTSTVDGNGNSTAITYGNVGDYSNLYPTQVVRASGTGVARTMQSGYDFYTGLVTSVTDYDNSVTTTTTYDIKLRPTLVTNADGSTLENEVRMDYHDHDRFIVTKADLVTAGDAKKVATQFFDQLGRVRLSKVLENASTQSATNETDGIKVETKYAYTTGYSWQLTSNPFRASSSSGAGSEETMGWTRTKSWAMDRQSEVETFSGASMPSPWGSNSSSTGIVNTQMAAANATQVTDQASKVRRSITDSLGRLEQIDEPTTSGLGSVTSPNQSTSYAYDVLNNLTGVTQGSQTRTFSYNSLGRLTSAINPERGTISYGYDSNGNLTSKTDARSVVTSYTYDALNRVTQRAYTAPSPTPANYQTTATVTYTYDNKTNAKGRLTKVSSSTSTTEYTSFDVLGRVTGHKQTTDSNDYTTSYTYNLAGQLLTETYPSGRMVQNTFATNGDLSQVQTKPSGGSYTNRASSCGYNPAGAVQSLQLGNGKYETTHFNPRLQSTQIGLGTSTTDTSLLKLEYGYGTTANNGNVVSQTITVPTVGANTGFVAVQNYTYDELNRLKSATENVTPHGGSQSQSWKQTYIFDRYGNRRFDFTSGNTTVPASSCTEAICNPTISTSTNRLTSTGWSYDSAGNTTEDASGKSFNYDAENKQTKATSGTKLGEYWYDGDGRRIKKDTSTSDDVIFIYDAAEKLIEERNLSGTLQTSYVFAGDRLLSKETEPATSTTYLTADHLGSPRINTDGSGNVVARHDYHPFGEEILTTNQRTSGLGYQADAVRNQFTAHERDAESNLDFAQSRYYNSVLGRFVSPDGPFLGQHLEDPQTWNLYQYAGNNPVRYTDPDGHDFWSKLANYVTWGVWGEEDEVQKEEQKKKEYLISQAERLKNADGSLIVQNFAGDWIRFTPDQIRSLNRTQTWLLTGLTAGSSRQDLSAQVLTTVIDFKSASPALKGDPYHPDSVDSRIKPEYSTNPAHKKGPQFDPRKTPEPPDAANIYNSGSTVRGDMGVWWGKNSQGQIYRFSSDNNRSVHFSGIIKSAEVPKAVRVQLGL